MCKSLLVALFLGLGHVAAGANEKSESYLITCLCMGDLGNQLAHFSEVLVVAKKYKRVLALQPFLNYRGRPGIIHDPLEGRLNVSTLAKYTSVLPMSEFLEWAKEGWPVAERKMACYRAEGCFHTEASNAGWNALQLNFAGDTTVLKDVADRSVKVYAPQLAHLLPIEYPTAKPNWHVFKHIRWNQALVTQASEGLKRAVPSSEGDLSSIISAHVRYNHARRSDCEQNIPRGLPRYYGTEQCVLGTALVSMEACFPEIKPIAQGLAEALQISMRQKSGKGISAFVIATETAVVDKQIADLLRGAVADSYEEKGESDVAKKLRKLPVVTLVEARADPWVDLAVLSESGIMVGNCVSSFSFVPAMMRKSRGQKTFYFGGPEGALFQQTASERDEL